MQKNMNGSLRTAAGAVESGGLVKNAGWKKVRCCRVEEVENQHQDCYNSNQRYCDNGFRSAFQVNSDKNFKAVHWDHLNHR